MKENNTTHGPIYKGVYASVELLDSVKRNNVYCVISDLNLLTRRHVST
jgi:hypothetical protein